MARSHIRLVVLRDQIALGAVGLLVMFAGGLLLWYFAVRPHHPSSYSLFDIAILPVGLLVIGMLCLLAAVGEFTGRSPASPAARMRARFGVGPEDR
jgi:drug/metabolite transporter (DMT)-like permease